MQTFIYQFVVLNKINRLTLKRFEQKYLWLSGFTFKEVRISPANTPCSTCMNETLYSWTFKFHKVVRQQNSGAVEDFILPYSAVYLRIEKWKNYWNRSTFAKVIVKIKVAHFLWPTVYIRQERFKRCCRPLPCTCVVTSQISQLIPTPSGRSWQSRVLCAVHVTRKAFDRRHSLSRCAPDVAAVAPLISGRTQVDDVATDWHGVDASSALLLHVDSRYAATARITTFVLAKLPYLLTVFTGTTHARRVTTVTSAPYCTVVLLRPGLERVIFGKKFSVF